MKITCPTCGRTDLDTTMKFYVPGHSHRYHGNPCDGGEKGSKPNHSKDGKKQLCFNCGRYCARSHNVCPHCEGK